MKAARSWLWVSLVLGLPAMLAACSRERDAVASREPAVVPKASASAAPKSATAIVPAKHGTNMTRHALSRSCETICATTDKLACKRANACQQSCRAMASAGVCDEQLGAFFECLKTQPSEHWECLEDGTAAIREGYCESEQAGFAQCLQAP